jgi:hypothetical protein
MKVKGWKIIYQEGVAIFTSEKVEMKPKWVTRDKGGYKRLITWTINQKEIIIVKLNAPNIGGPNFIAQTLLFLKGQIEHII